MPATRLTQPVAPPRRTGDLVKLAPGPSGQTRPVIQRGPTLSLMTLVQETLTSFRTRLAEIDKQISPLVAEADELRAAIAQLEGATASKPRSPRSASKRTAAKGRGSSGRRAARGSLRDAVIEGARKNPGMTSGQLAAELGLPRNSVATALSKLRASGDLPPRVKTATAADG